VRRLGLVILFAVGSAHSVAAEEDYNSLGRLGYAYWDCAAYGLLMKETPASANRLFQDGYEKLSRFLEAGKNGDLTDENTKDVPIGLSWYFVSGPSTDFSLGYMWSKFTEEAYNKTWPELEAASFADQEELQQAKARQAFQEKNCEVLAP